jgi:hypothetical protein
LHPDKQKLLRKREKHLREYLPENETSINTPVVKRTYLRSYSNPHSDQRVSRHAFLPVHEPGCVQRSTAPLHARLPPHDASSIAQLPVGENVGVGDGTDDGVVVGRSDGLVVGTPVVLGEGAGDGTLLGDTVGTCEGSLDGNVEGLSVGLIEG